MISETDKFVTNCNDTRSPWRMLRLVGTSTDILWLTERFACIQEGRDR